MKKLINISIVLVMSLSLVILAGCEKESDYEKEQTAIKEYVEENNITVEPKYSGLYYIETKAGTGADADGGDEVRVKYTGTFLDGEEFDSGIYPFILGAGRVIKGWDEGISYMKEGGKATLLIPSSLGYGAYGSDRIPGYSPLLFDVELLDVF